MKTLRLNHFLSLNAGVSRRQAEKLIQQKKVRVNGKCIENPGFKIHTEKDHVTLKNKAILHPLRGSQNPLRGSQNPLRGGQNPLRGSQKSQVRGAENPSLQKSQANKISLTKNCYYIAFNKPKKVITSMNDPKGRLSVGDFFKMKKQNRIFPIGRLDYHSEGLLLLTNDGYFSAKVLKDKPPKTYMVKLNKRPTVNQLTKLKKGVYTEIGRLRALYAQLDRKKNSLWVKVIVAEGKNRQLHRMFNKLGLQVKVLRRTAIGKLQLKSLKPGEIFALTPKDLKKVFSDPTEIQK